MTRFYTAAAAITLALGLSACGGGGSDSPAPAPQQPDDTSGIGRTGIAIGPISGFGSVIVNGVRYNTDSATFEVDDAAGVQDDLKVGQIVTIVGTVDANGTTGTAESVTYDDDVEGPIASIDIDNSTLIVLGVTIQISDNTTFDEGIMPESIEGLSVGQVIEVSGLRDANGNLAASFIEIDSDNSEFEVKGVVSSLNTAAGTFALGTQSIDFSTAMLVDFPSGEISDSDFVEVEGQLDSNTGALIASTVEFEDDRFDFDDGTQFEIEGLITRFVSATDFDVAGQPVTTNGSTLFTNGTDADLALSVRVEVDGTINADGVLVADEVDIRRDVSVRVAAQVDSVDANNDALVVLGIPVRIDALTRLEDNATENGTLSLSNLTAGDYVVVRGSEFPADSGEVLAARLERDDPEDDVELRGAITAISNPTITVLGVTIETNATTNFIGFTSQTDFFDQVSVGDVINVNGNENSATTIIASEIEREN